MLVTFVSGYSRDPVPPARMTPFRCVTPFWSQSRPCELSALLPDHQGSILGRHRPCGATTRNRTGGGAPTLSSATMKACGESAVKGLSERFRRYHGTKPEEGPAVSTVWWRSIPPCQTRRRASLRLQAHAPSRLPEGELRAMPEGCSSRTTTARWPFPKPKDLRIVHGRDHPAGHALGATLPMAERTGHHSERRPYGRVRPGDRNGWQAPIDGSGEPDLDGKPQSG